MNFISVVLYETDKRKAKGGEKGGMMIIMIIAMTYLAIHFLSPRVSNRAADSLEAFMATGFDHMIFYSIGSSPKDFPDSLDHSEYELFRQK